MSSFKNKKKQISFSPQNGITYSIWSFWDLKTEIRKKHRITIYTSKDNKGSSHQFYVRFDQFDGGTRNISNNKKISWPCLLQRIFSLFLPWDVNLWYFLFSVLWFLQLAALRPFLMIICQYWLELRRKYFRETFRILPKRNSVYFYRNFAKGTYSNFVYDFCEKTKNNIFDPSHSSGSDLSCCFLCR